MKCIITLRFVCLCVIASDVLIEFYYQLITLLCLSYPSNNQSRSVSSHFGTGTEIILAEVYGNPYSLCESLASECVQCGLTTYNLSWLLSFYYMHIGIHGFTNDYIYSMLYIQSVCSALYLVLYSVLYMF